MPLIWKPKKHRKYTEWFGVRFNKIERPFLPDIVTSVTIPNPNPFKSGRVTIWERAK